MKLAKLSLAAMVVAGLASSSFAADTLADAFKNGKASGELKAWYFQKDVEKAAGVGGGDVDIFTTAATLSYVTDSIYGFTFGATFQGAANPEASVSAKEQYKNENYAGGAVLSEAYLQYAIGKTTAKLGRQFISTPLVNGSGSRIYKEAFEGATIVNTDLPQTTLVAGYVEKFQGRTSNITGDTTGDAPKFKEKAAFTGGEAAGIPSAAFDDAYTIAAINKSITNLTLTAQYAIVTGVVGTPLSSSAGTGDIDVYYTEANYELPLSGFKLGFDINFRGSKTDTSLDVLNYEGHYTAARVSVKELAGFGASFAYGTTSKSDSVIAGMGNGPTSYTSTLINGTSSRMTPNTDSYLFAATYDFSKVGVAGLTAVAQYGIKNQSAFSQNGSAKAFTDITNFAAGVTYAVPALKGLTTSLEYENARSEAYDKDTHAKSSDKTADAMWFKAGYKF